MSLAIGFDLDMTLIDPRPGMVLLMNALAAETGLALPGEHFAENLGPPLDMIFRGYGAPEEQVTDLVARFRFLYPDIVVPATVAMAGAAAALAAVRAHGGRTLVLTGKYTANAALHLKALNWEVDVLVGELWAEGKGVELVKHQASVYVGDHGGDMLGAVSAGAVGVGVTTGPCDADTLLAAGADVVLSSLDEFPAWLDGHLRRTA